MQRRGKNIVDEDEDAGQPLALIWNADKASLLPEQGGNCDREIWEP